MHLLRMNRHDACREGKRHLQGPGRHGSQAAVWQHAERRAEPCMIKHVIMASSQAIIADPLPQAKTLRAQTHVSACCRAGKGHVQGPRRNATAAVVRQHAQRRAEDLTGWI